MKQKWHGTPKLAKQILFVLAGAWEVKIIQIVEKPCLQHGV